MTKKEILGKMKDDVVRRICIMESDNLLQNKLVPSKEKAMNNRINELKVKVGRQQDRQKQGKIVNLDSFQRLQMKLTQAERDYAYYRQNLVLECLDELIKAEK